MRLIISSRRVQTFTFAARSRLEWKTALARESQLALLPRSRYRSQTQIPNFKPQIAQISQIAEIYEICGLPLLLPFGCTDTKTNPIARLYDSTRREYGIAMPGRALHFNSWLQLQ